MNLRGYFKAQAFCAGEGLAEGIRLVGAGIEGKGGAEHLALPLVVYGGEGFGEYRYIHRLLLARTKAYALKAAERWVWRCPLGIIPDVELYYLLAGDPASVSDGDMGDFVSILQICTLHI